MTDNTSKQQTTCFHDGDCPLCEIEIKLMKKADHAKNIKWVDIAKDKAALAEAGLSYQQAMEKIHVIDPQGVKTGVDAFISVWGNLPYYRRLVPIVKLPFIYPVIAFGYRLFAKYRLALTGRKKALEDN